MSYAPSVSAVAPVASTKDSLNAVNAVAQSAEYTASRARRPRFTLRKLAGVSKPVNPGMGEKGNAAPPASKWVFAESSNDPMYVRSAELPTIGAGAALVGMSVATGAPEESKARLIRRKASALIV